MEEIAAAAPAQAPSAAVAPASGRGSPWAADLAGQGSWVSIVVWLFLFAVPLAVIVTAALLTPSAEGHGTHTQLGLPPCGFLVVTGYPCPGCGLTTSFAHMVRLQIGGALGANPFGVLLFTCTALSLPISLAGMLRRMPVIDTLDRLHAEKIAIGLSVVSILVWLVRIGIQYAAS
ncbi:MAG: DUF2752 domain-containing protein [Sandaracinaceae bacterium]|nr:DUF2752 domain-containing protein [Sandaracinaceae bacterium]